MNKNTNFSSARTLDLSYSLTIREAIVLFLLGALAMVIRAKLRIPLGLPGHHGIEFMLLIIIGKQLSKFRFAGAVSALGIVAMAFVPGFGFSDPFMALVFTVPCLLIDLFWLLFQKYEYKILLVALFAGLAYFSIPLVRTVLSTFTGVMYPSLLKGMVPFASHFIFGATGGLVAASIFKFAKKAKTQ